MIFYKKSFSKNVVVHVSGKSRHLRDVSGRCLDNKSSPGEEVPNEVRNLGHRKESKT